MRRQQHQRAPRAVWVLISCRRVRFHRLDSLLLKLRLASVSRGFHEQFIECAITRVIPSAQEHRLRRSQPIRSLIIQASLIALGHPRCNKRHSVVDDLVHRITLLASPPPSSPPPAPSASPAYLSPKSPCPSRRTRATEIPIPSSSPSPPRFGRPSRGWCSCPP